MGTPSITLQRTLQCASVPANELVPAVHNHLWGIRAFRGETRGVDALPVRKDLRRIRVLPAQIVPVGNVFADPNDQLAGPRLLEMNLTKQPVGRRTTGASFRGEQLQNHNPKKTRA